MLSLFTVGLIAGCSFPQPIPVGTKLLGQVSYVGQATDAAKLNPYWVPDGTLDGSPLSPTRLESGTTKQLIVSCNLRDDTESQVALVRLYYELHRGVHDHSEWAIVDTTSSVERGNIVELEMRQGASKSEWRCATITTIRAQSLEAGGCVYAHVQKSAGSAGLSSYRSLKCLGIESEGWKESTNWLDWTGPDFPSGNGVAWYKPPPAQTK